MSYVLKPCSVEQQMLLNKLQTSNLIVDSVAGSGKTTSILHIAKQYPIQKILCLTYNAKLKIETREKILALNLENIEAHSYHSFCVKNYSNRAYNDIGILDILKKQIKPKYPKNLNYDLLILDEAQDMTPIYYELIYKIASDNLKGLQICLLGDKFQSIYDFNKADSRYITHADVLFGINDLPWSKINLSESFRLTKPMADFLNVCVIGSDRVISNKMSNIKPRYLLTDAFGCQNSDPEYVLPLTNKFGLKKINSGLSTLKNKHTTTYPFDELKFYLSNGYQPSDIFILAPSIKNLNSPARKLENKIKMCMSNIPVYVPASDEEKLDEEVLENKLVFSTYHQAKGLERKVVIVYGFDSSYFEFFKKDADPRFCPNEIYVAITRASEYLSLIHHYENAYLPFMKINRLDQYVDFISKMPIQTKSKSENIPDVGVTDLIRHLPQDIITDCLKYIKRTQIRKPLIKYQIESKTKQKYGYENVSEITGTAIPSYYELIKKNQMTIYDVLCKLYNLNYESDSDSESDLFIDDEKFNDENSTKKPESKRLNLSSIDIYNLKPEELLYISNLWTAYKTGYVYKLEQIDNYGWLNNSILDQCIQRLNSLNISSNAEFEKRYSASNQIELSGRKINGYFDCVDVQQNKTNIYEFKCVGELTEDHFLQLAVYMYLHKLSKSTDQIKSDQIKSDQIKSNHNMLNLKNDLLMQTVKYKTKYSGTIMKKLENSTYLIRSSDNSGKSYKIKLNEKIKYNISDKATFCKVETGIIIDIIYDDNNDSINIDSIKLIINNPNNQTQLIDTEQIMEIINNKDLTNRLTKQPDLVTQIDSDNYFLYNILSDELYQIETSFDELKQMIDYLIQYKYFNKSKMSDSKFLSSNNDIIQKYIG
jgi:hypothetical protein